MNLIESKTVDRAQIAQTDNANRDFTTQDEYIKSVLGNDWGIEAVNREATIPTWYARGLTYKDNILLLSDNRNSSYYEFMYSPTPINNEYQYWGLYFASSSDNTLVFDFYDNGLCEIKNSYNTQVRLILDMNAEIMLSLNKGTQPTYNGYVNGKAQGRFYPCEQSLSNQRKISVEQINYATLINSANITLDNGFVFLEQFPRDANLKTLQLDNGKKIDVFNGTNDNYCGYGYIHD